MQNKLIVSALPLDIRWADKEANFTALDNALRQLPAGTDVLVLPELFSTGYINDPSLLYETAELNTGETIDKIKERAAAFNTAIAGSFLARTAHRCYNRGFFIEPSGEETFYDKHHLFSLSDEAKVMAHGIDRLPIVRFRGWNIALIICYDLRFPVWCRSHRASYDVMLVPANWPKAREYAWKHLLIARAIENQAAVVGANRGGSDDYGEYDNLTYIFDSLGIPVGTAPEGSPFVTAVLDKEMLDRHRAKFPVADDCDDFSLVIN